MPSINAKDITELLVFILNKNLGKNVFEYINYEMEGETAVCSIKLKTKTEQEFLDYEPELKESGNYSYRKLHRHFYIIYDLDDKYFKYEIEYLLIDIKDQYPFLEKYITAKLDFDKRQGDYDHKSKKNCVVICYKLKKDDALIDKKICRTFKAYKQKNSTVAYFNPSFGIVQGHHSGQYVNTMPLFYEVEETDLRNLKCSTCKSVICKFFITRHTPTNEDVNICRLCAMIANYNINKVRKVQKSKINNHSAQQFYDLWYDAKFEYMDEQFIIYDKLIVLFSNNMSEKLYEKIIIHHEKMINKPFYTVNQVGFI